MFGASLNNNCGCEIIYWKNENGEYVGKAITANCASQFGTEIKRIVFVRDSGYKACPRDKQ